jgi:hypothetical protein
MSMWWSWNEENWDMLQHDVICDNDWVEIQDNNAEDIIINTEWWEWGGVWNNEDNEKRMKYGYITDNDNTSFISDAEWIPIEINASWWF